MSIHVTSRVWDECRQSGERLLVMLSLADFSNDEGICWPSQATLAKRARCTERGVQKMIDGLISEGEITIIKEGGGRGRSAVYKLSRYIKGEPDSANMVTIKGERGAERANVVTIKGEQAVPPNHNEPSKEPSKKSRATESEIKEFCKSIGLPESDGEAMFLHWEEKGWGKVKDWRLTIRKWKSFGYLPSQKHATHQRNHRNGSTRAQGTADEGRHTDFAGIGE